MTGQNDDPLPRFDWRTAEDEMLIRPVEVGVDMFYAEVAFGLLDRLESFRAFVGDVILSGEDGERAAAFQEYREARLRYLRLVYGSMMDVDAPPHLLHPGSSSDDSSPNI